MADNVWSFGYGSNMDVKALETKKHVKILDHVGAILKGWRMSFSLQGISYVEPSYANIIKGGSDDEVHGVAFCMGAESIAELDRVESGYNKTCVTLLGYDGRSLSGFVYVNKPGAKTDEIAPSDRYVGVLVKGAKAAGLKEEYIEKLKRTKTYTPPEHILKKRKALPEPDTLSKFTIADVAKHDGRNEDYATWISVYGYIIQANSYFASHRGRDITTRFLMQFHGKALDDNDDRGCPPYPITANLTEAETEYVWRWFDHYYSRSETQNKVVGYLHEFDEQQKSGSSSWKLPEK